MRRRDDFLDSRITQTAVDLFKLACNMLNDGVDCESREFSDVAFALNRELKFRPWHRLLLELETYDIDPAELETEEWRVQRELHRQLVAGCSPGCREQP